jgi:hypothetical protein
VVRSGTSTLLTPSVVMTRMIFGIVWTGGDKEVQLCSLKGRGTVRLLRLLRSDSGYRQATDAFTPVTQDRRSAVVVAFICWFEPTAQKTVPKNSARRGTTPPTTYSYDEEESQGACLNATALIGLPYQHTYSTTTPPPSSPNQGPLPLTLSSPSPRITGSLFTSLRPLFLAVPLPGETAHTPAALPPSAMRTRCQQRRWTRRRWNRT